MKPIKRLGGSGGGGDYGRRRDPAPRVRRLVDLDEYGDIPQAIFGFFGTYCCVCIRRHPHLDHVTVQLC